MGKIIRTITSTGEAMCIAVDATDIVERAQQIHKTSAVTSAALLSPGWENMIYSYWSRRMTVQSFRQWPWPPRSCACRWQMS